jgi:hypothetical protein
MSAIKTWSWISKRILDRPTTPIICLATIDKACEIWAAARPSFCARFARSCWVRQSKQVVPALLMLACTVPVLVALTAFIATFLREDTGALVRAELYASAFAGAAEGLLFVVMVLWPQIEVVVLLVSIWSAYQDEAAVVDFVIWFYNFVRVPVYSTHS